VTGAARVIGPIGANEAIQGITITGYANSQERGFDICLQDDRSGDSLQFDSCTGNFQFTSCSGGGSTLTGTARVSRVGNLITLRANRIFALYNVNQSARVRTGFALVRSNRLSTINDNDTSDNTCGCR
jgi:hypothetical protein